MGQERETSLDVRKGELEQYIVGRMPHSLLIVHFWL